MTQSPIREWGSVAFTNSEGAALIKELNDRTVSNGTYNSIDEASTQIALNATAITGKQDTLVSGTNIKTINGESLLGSTDIVIAGGGDMSAATYDAAAVSEQLVGLTATQTLTNKTLDSFTNDIYANHVHEELRNESGVTINIGDAVYISGYSIGQNLALVDLADSTNSTTLPCVAIVSDVSIANNANGGFIEVGTLSGVDTSSWSVGDDLYVSETGTTGNTLTNIKPTGTALIQKIGEVLRSHATLGVIEVFGAGRTNDLPNIADTKIWIGDTNGVPQEFALSGGATMTAGGVLTVVTNANLTGHITSTGNAAILGSFTKAQLSTAISDGTPIFVGDAAAGEVNTINSTTVGEPIGSDVVLNIVSLTQAEYDAGTPVDTTNYLITDAAAPDELTLDDEVGTTYTYVLANQSQLVTHNNAASIAATVPTNAVAAFPIGAQINIYNKGAGLVTVGGAGVTINTSSTLVLRAQHSMATLIKIATDEWILTGDLTAV